MSTENKRRDLGNSTLAAITGGTGAAVVESLKDIAPDLAEWIISFAYGDVMARPGLNKRSRQLATIAALTAMGSAAPQLKVHIRGALNVGCMPQEILEASALSDDHPDFATHIPSGCHDIQPSPAAANRRCTTC